MHERKFFVIVKLKHITLPQYKFLFLIAPLEIEHLVNIVVYGQPVIIYIFGTPL